MKRERSKVEMPERSAKVAQPAQEAESVRELAPGRAGVLSAIAVGAA